MYKFRGQLGKKSRLADLEGPGGIYFVKISARMFAPFFAVTVYRPRRRGARRLVAEPFDYRAAQHSGVLEPRDSPWYSRSEVTLRRDTALTSPDSDPDLPATIAVIMRISWWPVHVAATWLDGGEGFQKLSARPKENAFTYLLMAIVTAFQARSWNLFLSPCDRNLLHSQALPRHRILPLPRLRRRNLQPLFTLTAGNWHSLKIATRPITGNLTIVATGGGKVTEMTGGVLVTGVLITGMIGGVKQRRKSDGPSRHRLRTRTHRRKPRSLNRHRLFPRAPRAPRLPLRPYGARRP